MLHELYSGAIKPGEGDPKKDDVAELIVVRVKTTGGQYKIYACDQDGLDSLEGKAPAKK